MTRSLIIAIASALALSATPALAHESSRVQVSYADLDTAKTADSAELYGRLHRAAANVCGDRTGPMQLVERQQMQRCISATMDRAVARVGSPTLAAYHFDHTGATGRMTIAAR